MQPRTGSQELIVPSISAVEMRKSLGSSMKDWCGRSLNNLHTTADRSSCGAYSVLERGSKAASILDLVVRLRRRQHLRADLWRVRDGQERRRRGLWMVGQRRAGIERSGIICMNATMPSMRCWVATASRIRGEQGARGLELWRRATAERRKRQAAM